MASEYGIKAPLTPSSNSGESYIGCFISLISKCEIRYEGVLYFLNIQDSTLGLKNVRSYGTEGRRKDGLQVPPNDKVYESILFRGNNIKNLQVKSPSASTKAEEQIFSDPAIIQSQYSGVQSSPVSSVGRGSLTESIQRQDSFALTSKALPVGLPSHQSLTQLGPLNSSAATQVAGHPCFSTPMYWQGHSGTPTNSTHSLQQPSPLQPPSMLSPLTMQNLLQTSRIQPPTKVGWTSLSECDIPVSSVTASSLLNPTCAPSPASLKIPDSLDIPPLLSTKTPIPYSEPITSNGSNMSWFSSPVQDINSIDGQISGKICSDPKSRYPGHAVHHSASSFVDSTSVPLLTPPYLLTPDQFAQPREHLFYLTPKLTPNQKDMGSLTHTSTGSSVLVPSTASQAPLLPLPTSVQKPQYSASKFTEEFDFVAMNEKFKKDEVWGSLGKATKKTEEVEDNASPHMGDCEWHGLIPNPEPAYKKDDFFDTISCNSLTCGSRNGQNRLYERMKLDTETFGNFQQGPNVGYNGYGAAGRGRGENFRGSYNWGRGYGYGGRGRGRNFPF